jgi:hypothetical protein
MVIYAVLTVELVDMLEVWMGRRHFLNCSIPVPEVIDALSVVVEGEWMGWTSPLITEVED